MKITYDTTEYELSNNGKTPRGRGSWVLQVIEIDGAKGEGELHFSRGGLTLTEARKELRQRFMTEILDLNANAEEVTIAVLP